jgi:hypothetical protein
MLITLLKDEYMPSLDGLREDSDFGHFVSILGEILLQSDHAVLSTPLILDMFADWPGVSRWQSQAFKEMARAVSLRELPFEQVTDGLILTGPAGPVQDPVSGPRWMRDKMGGTAWLDAHLPDDPALREPAALVWSWGLSLPRRVRGVPSANPVVPGV